MSSPSHQLCCPDAGCTELYLGNEGIEHLQGFEKLVRAMLLQLTCLCDRVPGPCSNPYFVLQVNLEALWLGGNKLQSVTGLDANFRIRALQVNVGPISLQTAWGGTRPLILHLLQPFLWQR